MTASEIKSKYCANVPNMHIKSVGWGERGKGGVLKDYVNLVTILLKQISNEIHMKVNITKPLPDL